MGLGPSLPGSRRPLSPDRRLARTALLGAVILLASGCLLPMSSNIGPEDDPRGTYEVTMASAGMVSEGTMTIHGSPGAYRGTLALPSGPTPLEKVRVGTGRLDIEAELPSGRLIVRLVRDGTHLSGNWVLGSRRGTFTANRQPDP